MKPTPIYKDHTGQWRPKNPFPHERQEFDPDRGFDYTGLTENENYTKFEQSIPYHDFPNAPDVELGVVVMAELQTDSCSLIEDIDVNRCKCGYLNPEAKFCEHRKQIWIPATPITPQDTAEEAAIKYAKKLDFQDKNIEKVLELGFKEGTNYQSTKDAKEIVELREEVDRLKESLLKIVHGSIHDAYTTAKEALKVKP